MWRSLLPLLAAAAAPAAAAPETASTVCVYNAAWFVLKWRLRDTDTSTDSSETK
eukprot:gene44738-42954_t